MFEQIESLMRRIRSTINEAELSFEDGEEAIRSNMATLLRIFQEAEFRYRNLLSTVQGIAQRHPDKYVREEALTYILNVEEELSFLNDDFRTAVHKMIDKRD